MNKHNESVLKAIETLQKQGKSISNKNVHAITGGSIALVGECVKAWKDAQKAQKPVANEVPEELKAFADSINAFILKFTAGVLEAKTEELQNEIKDLKLDSLELVDNIKQVEAEKEAVNKKLASAVAETIELKKQIAVEAAKSELIINNHMAEIDRLKQETTDLKDENKEYKKLLIKR